QGPQRPAVLARAAAVPRHRLQRHGRQHPARGGAEGRKGARTMSTDMNARPRRETKPPAATGVHVEGGAAVPAATAATREGPEHPTQPMVYDAILLSGFGGPEGQEDVLPCLRNVTRGRGIPDERLEEVAHHYRHFGGVSPINEQNRELLRALRAAL